MTRVLLILLVLPLLCVAALAQTVAPPQLLPRPSTPPPGGTDRQIVLDVQVADKSGAPVRGLQKQDFTLLDNGQPQDISSVQAIETTADAPVEMVLVVDMVNTPFRGVSFEREQVKKFLLGNGGKLSVPVSLVVFSETGTKVQNGSSRDGNAEAGVYDQFEAVLRSGNLTNGAQWGAAESVELSLKSFMGIAKQEEKPPGRKLMIWLGRGWPVAGEGSLRTSKDSQQLFDWITSLSTALRQARITLYSIDPVALRNAGAIRNSGYETFLKPATSPSRAVPGNLALPVIAVQSGGRVFNSSGDVNAAIADCIADANWFYVFSFQGARASQANEYHSLEIRVHKPGLKVRTRAGYYAQP